MRLLPTLVAALLIAAPVLAAGPYTPLPLQPAKTVTPPPQLLTDATAFLQAVRQGDGDTIARYIAPKVTTVSGGLELAFPRHKDTSGPFDTIEEMLSDLANNTGGDIPLLADGSESPALRIDAEREFIVQSLTDPTSSWGTDPMVKGAICSYAYRSYDVKAIKRLSEKTGVQSSSFVYVDKPYELLKTADAKAETVGTLETDRLYALDYNTDAPRGWIAVFLPDGSSGFANHEAAGFGKPYAVGLCFAKGKEGRWVMVAQASTGL